jgi:alkylation response protein AidB-like acyl-CoA dehydrogenase
VNFGLSDEQKILEASLRRYLAESVPTTRVREIVDTESGHDAKVWRDLAELGALGVLVPEAHGGSGLSVLDAALVAESLGWAATPVPYLATTVLAPTALAAASPALQSKWLPRIATGDIVLGAALTEAIARRGDAGLRVERDRLHGTALFALDASVAGAFLVALGPDRIALVPRDAAGLVVTPLATIDRTRRVAELVFEGTAVGDAIEAQGLVARVVAAGRVALAADTLGACERAIEMAVAYAKQREQFGRAIATFQAVKHLCAEMVAEVEPARSLVWYAAHAQDERPDEAIAMAAHAKAHLAEVGTMVVRTATEVHGGIGFTHEHDLHFWFKRAGLNRQLLGGPELVRTEAAILQAW